MELSTCCESRDAVSLMPVTSLLPQIMGLGLDKEGTLCEDWFGCLEKIREDCTQYDYRRVPIRI